MQLRGWEVVGRRPAHVGAGLSGTAMQMLLLTHAVLLACAAVQEKQMFMDDKASGTEGGRVWDVGATQGANSSLVMEEMQALATYCSTPHNLLAS